MNLNKYTKAELISK